MWRSVVAGEMREEECDERERMRNQGDVDVLWPEEHRFWHHWAHFGELGD